jgi:hypothetical protein
MTKNILYVGMMYDIATLLNLENMEEVDKIYVIDIVDINYGQFIEGEKNSWNTLKLKIKNILINGECYHKYEKINQYIKYGKSIILNESEEFLQHTNNSDIPEELYNYYDIYLNKRIYKLNFLIEKINKKIELIFYAGFSSDEIWPTEINNISTIITCASSFYCNEEITTQMIKEKCNLPFDYYQLYFNCDKTKFEKINNKNENSKVLFIEEIGKTIINDFNNMKHIANY